MNPKTPHAQALEPNNIRKIHNHRAFTPCDTLAQSHKTCALSGTSSQNRKIHTSNATQSDAINKLCAFTLAEVLITLAIIGVVAALTIPTVVRNYQKKQTVTKLKKVYTTFNQVIQMIVVDNGDMLSWDGIKTSKKKTSAELETIAHKYFISYLKVLKVCSSENITDCWWNEKGGAYTLNNTYRTSHAGEVAAFILSDGVSIAIQNNSMGSFYMYNVSIDLNGVKPPNTFGKDIFVLTPFGQKEYDLKIGNSLQFVAQNLTRSDITGANSNGCCSRICNDGMDSQGRNCGALIIKDGWQIKDDYPW